MRPRADVGGVGAPARGPARAVPARLQAELRWSAQRAQDLFGRCVTYPRATTPTATPDRCVRLFPRRRVRMAMRDGAILAADVYEPQPLKSRPVVLIRMPYGIRAHPRMAARGTYWARKGYTCVIQDVRGRGASQGVWTAFVNEARDGWDTLEWVTGQPWCDGRIGMVGESYYGSTQWAVAALGHPSLRCIAPGNTTTDWYGFAHPGGAFAHATAGAWAWEMQGRGTLNGYRFDPWHLPLLSTDEAAGQSSPQYKDWVRHWTRDGYWADLSAASGRAGTAVPALHWGGWHDIMLEGALSSWTGARRTAGDKTLRQRQWLAVAGVDHQFTAAETGAIGRLPAARAWSFDRVQRFVDRWLGDEPNGQEADAPVSLYVAGRDEWREDRDWPPPSARPLTLNLHSRGRAAADPEDGVLAPEPPGQEPADGYRYDPAHPASWWLGYSVYGIQERLGDRRTLQRRPDVLTYSTPPLERGLEVLGPVTARLTVASDCPDTDFTAALVDVFPDGYAQLVCEGVRRARFRSSFEQEELLEPAAPARVDIEIAGAGHFFGPGHRLRLELSSSNFGRWDRNLNTGHALGMDDEMTGASNRVLHERGAVSALDLWVVDEEM